MGIETLIGPEFAALQQQGQAQLQQSTQDWKLPQSALPDIGSRTAWGFADDFGKMNILHDHGYTDDQIVRLNNGEFGVRTQFGIKPVDPKGFQFGDIGGDIAESLGKGITVGGGILGALATAPETGGLGSPMGAGIGAAGGEAIRQEIGTAMGVRNPQNEMQLSYRDPQGNLKLGGLGEIAGEGLLAGGSQLLANSILTKLGIAGSMKLAASAMDQDFTNPLAKESGNNLLDNTIDDTTNTRIIDVWKKLDGLKNDQGVIPLREYLTPGGMIANETLPTDERAVDTLAQAGDKALKLINKGPEIEDELYAQGLKDAGIDTATYPIDVSKQVNKITNIVGEAASDPFVMKSSPGAVQSLSGLLEKINAGAETNGVEGLLTYNQLKEVTENARNLTSQLYSSEDPLASKASQIYQLLRAGKNSEEVLKNLNANFGEGMGALQKLQDVLRLTKVDAEGVIEPGYRGPATMMRMLGSGIKQSRLQEILDTLNTIEKVPAMAPLSFKKDMLRGILGDQISKASATQMTAMTPVGWVRNWAVRNMFPARARVAVQKGLMNILQPNVLDENVGRVLKVPSMLMHVAGAANIPRVPAKAVSAGIQAGATTGFRSLNSILYGK